jgi:hypothetical protein
MTQYISIDSAEHIVAHNLGLAMKAASQHFSLKDYMMMQGAALHYADAKHPRAAGGWLTLPAMNEIAEFLHLAVENNNPTRTINA